MDGDLAQTLRELEILSIIDRYAPQLSPFQIEPGVIGVLLNLLEILSNVVDGEVRRRSPEPSNRP